MDYDEVKAMVKSGMFNGYKMKYPKGAWCTVWIEDEHLPKICFDFPETGSEDLMQVLKDLNKIPAKEYIPDPSYEAFKKKRDHKESTWWYKFWDVFDDIGITITPFDWKFRSFMVNRPIPMKDGDYGFAMCRGFFFGPIAITW